MKPQASIHAGPVARTVIAVLVGLFFLVPLLGAFEFTLREGRDYTGAHSFVHWAGIFDSANAGTYRPLWIGLTNSLVLMVTTVAIVLLVLAPTMILVNLKFPRLRRAFEFLALLPITIPAIVLVVGLVPIYQVIGRNLGTGAWTLCFAYGILVLPFSFRSIQASIDATNMTTLAEAARSLGASWPTVVWRVLAPNLRSGLLAASLISVAVVLGEYTIASLLNRQNLQAALIVVNHQDPFVSKVFTLLALTFCFVLLLLISRVGQAGARRKERS
ncbi:MAG: ABC transporter permease subunit [Propionicimonas sp.]|nr:ABC transporter permease subunit [Propionicimonas sp.]